MSIEIAVSYGEVVDKITILEIKMERIDEESKRNNVRNELSKLMDAWADIDVLDNPIDTEWTALKRVNQQLWDIEDRIRLKEKHQVFDQDFIELARQVYLINDERASIKRTINERMGSSIIEEKSYQDYRN